MNEGDEEGGKRGHLFLLVITVLPIPGDRGQVIDCHSISLSGNLLTTNDSLVCGGEKKKKDSSFYIKYFAFISRHRMEAAN